MSLFRTHVCHVHCFMRACVRACVIPIVRPKNNGVRPNHQHEIKLDQRYSQPIPSGKVFSKFLLDLVMFIILTVS
jgi:hypothetical protein